MRVWRGRAIIPGLARGQVSFLRGVRCRACCAHSRPAFRPFPFPPKVRLPGHCLKLRPSTRVPASTLPVNRLPPLDLDAHNSVGSRCHTPNCTRCPTRRSSSPASRDDSHEHAHPAARRRGDVYRLRAPRCGGNAYHRWPAGAAHGARTPQMPTAAGQPGSCNTGQAATGVAAGLGCVAAAPSAASHSGRRRR